MVARFSRNSLPAFVLALCSAALLLAPWSLTQVRAEEGAVTAETRGYLEARYQALFGLDEGLADLPAGMLGEGFNPEHQHGVITRLRPTLDVFVGDNVWIGFTPEAHTYHLFDDRDQDEFSDVVSLERLYLTTSQGDVDLTFGKQAIGWGSGLLLNPTDIFYDAPVSDSWKERPGVWAVRSSIALGDEASFIAAVATRDDPACCDAVAIGRFEGTYGLTDLATQVAWDERSDTVMGGLDIKSEIEVGIWGEATYSWDLEEEEGHFDLEVGLDYSFAVMNQLYVALEYMRQGDGLEGDYAQGLMFGASGEERPRFLGIDYLVAMMRLQMTNEWQMSLTNLTNLGDPSGAVITQVTWFTTDWLELIAGFNLMYGSGGGEFALEVPALDPASVAGGELPSALADFSTDELMGAAQTLGELEGERLAPPYSATLWARLYF